MDRELIKEVALTVLPICLDNAFIDVMGEIEEPKEPETYESTIKRLEKQRQNIITAKKYAIAEAFEIGEMFEQQSRKY